MLLAPRFVFCCYPDRPSAAHGAFVLANPAANAAFQVNVRLLKPNLNFQVVSWLGQTLLGRLWRKRQDAFRVFQDFPVPLFFLSDCATNIVSCCQSPWY